MFPHRDHPSRPTGRSTPARSTGGRLDPVGFRLIAALAHTVPGGELELTTTTGRRFRVTAREDAARTPCALRSLLAGRTDAEVTAIVDEIARVRLTGTLVDLGAGLYGVAERRETWLATTLPHPVVESLLARCPIPAPDSVVGARISVDTGLGVTVVCISVFHPLWSLRLDEIGEWLRGAVLIAEIEMVLGADGVPPASP